MKNNLLWIFAFVIIIFTASCDSGTLKATFDHVPAKGPDITISSIDNLYFDSYVDPDGHITVNFTLSESGSYQVRVYNSSNTMISGSTTLWGDYTVGSTVSVDVYGPNDSVGRDFYFNGRGDFTVQILGRDLSREQSSENIIVNVLEAGVRLVHSAGSTSVNGVYDVSGNPEIYIKRGDSTSRYQLFNDIHYPGWILRYYVDLGHVDNCTYYLNDGGGWVVGTDGTAPVPTVKLIP